ncbi:MAG: V-type ATP synthase subunit K [Clostridia bacterium]|jgi:V/A-type H+-transporting ATPase subunit K|nr:V-type ATP synthase subunit K [Clostridia bacterium]MBQ2201221.1 V-type ATP synthase subunit K [Clostridia bacterium]
MNWGAIWATAGAVIAALLAGIGSAIGVGITGQASAGVVSENPDLSGKCLLLQLLPGTQGIYGLLIAVVIALQSGLMSGDVSALTTTLGVRYLLAGLPIAFGGLLSAIYQGKVAVAGINMVAKKPTESGKGMVMAIMVETYAVLSLLISFLLVIGIK